jgi:hypothetical protein
LNKIRNLLLQNLRFVKCLKNSLISEKEVTKYKQNVIRSKKPNGNFVAKESGGLISTFLLSTGSGKSTEIKNEY